MPYCVEISLQVYIDDPCLVVDYRFRHSIDWLPCSCRFRQGRGGFPQLTVHLSPRVAAATPPPPFYLSASISRGVLPSPKLKRLDQWYLSLTRLLLRSRKLR